MSMSMLSFLPQPLTLLSFFTTILILLYLLLNVTYISHKLRRDLTLSPYGPPTYPVIGCLISFYQNRHRLLAWYTDLLTDSPTQTIKIRRLGATTTIVTANPKNVEYMLRTNFSNFPKGKPFTEILDDFLGRGIFNVDRELWHTQRKLASQEFSTKALREYVVKTLKEGIEKKLFPILDSLSIMEPANKVVDFQELLRIFGFDMVCRVSLGFDPCCLNNSLTHVSPLLQAFDIAAEISAKRASAPISALWKIKRMFCIGSEKRLKNAVQEIHAFVMNVVHDKKREISTCSKQVLASKGNDDLLSRMIMAGLDDEVIRDMMISFIMAGRDTTSAAMTWLFHLLSLHPHIEQELVNEVEFVDRHNGSLSSYESLKQMRFLKACLCETMRLYPPVAWDSKHANNDDLLPDGTPVRAGDRVTYFPYGMGRMENLWGKDRFEFRPDRWFIEPDRRGGGLLKKVSPYKYPVFQAGPRVCIGKELAFIQMKYVVASILKVFEVRPAGSEEAVFVPLLTAHMAGGFKVTIRRRKPTPDPAVR